MKKNIFTSLAVVGLTAAALCGCGAKSNQSVAESAENADAPKALVCYFSATGTTEKAAQRIANLINAPVHEIVPQSKYTDADLDWRDSLSRSSVEMRNPDARPATADSVPDLAQYDVVFIGYPNWWNTHPRIINTFIEHNDLQSKTIVPFMTSGGSTIDNSVKDLHESYPSLTIAKGLLMNNVTDEEIKAWLKEMVLMPE